MTASAIISPPLQAPAPTPLVPTATPSASSSGMSFGDILDTINPLQHIPVISSIYRAVTGSTISPGAQVAGDTLYGAAVGGPILAGAALGFASSVADVTVQQQTGKDIAGNVLSALGSSSTSAAQPASVAATALTPADNATTIAAVAQAATNAAPPGPNYLHALFNQSQNPKLPNAQYQRTQAFDAMNKHLVKMAV